MSSELLIDKVRHDFEAIITAIQSDLPERSANVGGFFYDVMRAREKIHGEFDPTDKLGDMREGHANNTPTGLVVGGWLIAYTQAFDRREAPWFKYPTPADVRLAVRLFGLNVRKVVAWLELDQTDIFHSQMRRNLHIEPGGGAIELSDIPFIHRTLIAVSRIRNGFQSPLVMPDLKTMATIGALTDEEIVALAWDNHSVKETMAPHSPEIPTWLPDLVSLAQCRATPSERKYCWKYRDDLTVDDLAHLHARFPGPSQRNQGIRKLLIALARGKPASTLLSMFTAKEAHEFLYSTAWHDERMTCGYAFDQYGFLVRKLDLLEFRSARLRPDHFKVLRWLRHLLDTGKRESLNKDRRFVDAYNLPYSSYYYARLDEVRDEDIVNVSDGLSTVFARVDDRLRRDVDLADEDLDDPLCTMPDLGNYLPEGWKFLTTRRELIGEGKRLKHCVAGYHKSVSEGNCFILSICDQYGMSTVELRPGRFAQSPETEILVAQLSVYQHKSVRNSAPPDAHVAHLSALLMACDEYIRFEKVMMKRYPVPDWVIPSKGLIIKMLACDSSRPKLFSEASRLTVQQRTYFIIQEMFTYHAEAVREATALYKSQHPESPRLFLKPETESNNG